MSQIAGGEDEDVSLSQQQINQINIPVAASHAYRKPPPRLPCRDLIAGPRIEYLKIGVPLYEASVKGDWRAAKVIFDIRPELVRYSITENDETALHVAVSTKISKKVEEFVENLVRLMTKEDLELENRNYSTAMYLAAAAGNLKPVKVMLQKNKFLIEIPGGGGVMMPLYVATLFGKYQVVKYLYDHSNKLRGDAWTSENRRWLLQKCVESNLFDMALQILEAYPGLGDYNSVLVILARKPEAFSGAKSNIIMRSISTIFSFICLKVRLPKKDDGALRLLRKVWEDVSKKEKNEIDRILRGPSDPIKKDHERLVSGNVDQVLQLQKLITEHVANMNVETHHVIQAAASGKENQALRLQELISEHTAKMHVETQKIIKGPAPQPSSGNKKIRSTFSSRLLFVAAEMGNTEFLAELIRQYPDLIWKVNDNNQSLFHVAVKHRHHGIYNLLYEIGSMKDLITPLKDEDDNNMLHLTGQCAKKKRLEDVSGAALQMQRELLWFQEVERMIPPSYRERRNKDGLTPHELFSEEHKDLITDGEKWMKGTASQCMVVAALIATIVFAATFTVPGGYNQNNGIPIFYKKQTFIVFVVADAISLFFSAASILTFLSILTSRYAERDFVASLPMKLMLGHLTLFLSITTMVVAFSISFFILYHKGMIWIAILMGVFAVFPVLLYIVLQYHLLIDVIRSTYGSKYLFKPENHVLYYQNPKF